MEYQILEEFGSWLKKQNYVTADKAYPGYMKKIKECLSIPVFLRITDVGQHKKWFHELDKNLTFLKFSQHNQTNFNSGYESFLKFLEQRKSKEISKII